MKALDAPRATKNIVRSARFSARADKDSIVLFSTCLKGVMVSIQISLGAADSFGNVAIAQQLPSI
ncbi:MAG: hypothetical protein P0Y56_07300 [Candidatus Andeanibacterium colombiense]|uniref:Uncharacterized protein n=1 Tax=Candidatus Andeanibacterium colombiense TaxID=3121345 RepID=A0AAJ5X9K0_9SPHN|nr:MAG: hypothetical protein P0Y56_07300 [Sphingomonadaceae bacterium]